MKSTEKKTALVLFIDALAHTDSLESVKAALTAADAATSVADVDSLLNDAQESVARINARSEAQLAMAIIGEPDVDTAWGVYLSHGIYTPLKITTTTKKGVTTHSVKQGDDLIVSPVKLFDAYKEKHGVSMVSEGYMTAVIDFYWAFCSSKVADLDAAPLKLKEKYAARPASGNDLEKLMNTAAQALYSAISFKLYRKNLVAINDYIVKGTVFKARIGGENKLIDALVRCMMVEKANRKIVIDARGKCIDR